MTQNNKARQEFQTSKTTYQLIETTSQCPNRHEKATLLMSTEITPKKPAFYICFTCGFVGEVGVGPVEQIHYKRKGER